MNLVNPYRFNIGGGSYSPEAQLVFDNMSALSVAEMDDMAIFIDDNHAVGNWNMVNDIWCFILNPTDRLIRWKSGLSATNEGASFGVNGASTNGIDSYINLEFAPDEGVQFAGDDRQSSIFLNSMDNIIEKYVFGAHNGAGLINGIRIQNTVPAFRCFSNRNIHIQQSFTAPIINKLLTITTLNNDVTGYMEDGIEIANLNTGIPPIQTHTEKIIIGGINLAGNMQDFLGLTSPFFAVCANAGFDYVIWNTTIRTFLTARGMTL